MLAFQVLVAEAWRKGTGGVRVAPFSGTYVGTAFGLWSIVVATASRARGGADSLVALAVSSTSVTVALALLVF